MNTHPSKKGEFNHMMKYNSYVEVTVMENSQMSEPIKCIYWEEVEQLISVHGAENVYF